LISRLTLLSCLLIAQSVLAANADKLPEASNLEVNSGDNVWLLISSAFVLMMVAPGLILFYGGLVRKKNVLSTMAHSLVLMALVSTLWMVFGYSASFAEGSPVIGSLSKYFMLGGVGQAPEEMYAKTVPHQSFMLFQMMFAIITPALISGAIAERIKFGAYILFSVLWTSLVYFPLCHMVWGPGGLFNWAGGGKIPVLDFAGGIVVHVSSGVAALVASVVLGKRLGYPQEPMPPHNVVFSLVGTGLLWVGWFGFNAGSALSAGGLASSAFAATHFSGVAAALSWTALEWCHKGKPSVLGIASGMVAGLATITPASGFVTVSSAFLIGLAGGAVCYFSVGKLKSIFNYDDSLDVFGVHGMGSAVGLILVGWFADASVNPAISNTYQKAGQVVALGGGITQVGYQAVAVVFTVVFSGVLTFVCLKIAGLFTKLRVEAEDEDVGLDLSQHGERSYND